MGRIRQLLGALLIAVAPALVAAPPAAAGGFSYTQMAPLRGIAPAGAHFRFQTIILGRPHHRLTVVLAVTKHGGRLARHWELGGAWHLSAPAYDREGTGLAARAPVLVLTRYATPPHSALRSHTELAVIDTGPQWTHRPDPIRRGLVPGGDYTVQAISPDGRFVYLSHNLTLSPAHGPRFAIVPWSVRARLLLPANDIRDNGEILSGSAIARTADASGRRVYTLYMDPLGPRGRMYLLALDTVGASLAKVELPRLRGTKSPLLLDLHLAPSGHFLTIRRRSSRNWVDRETTVARIDLRRLQSPGPGLLTAPFPPGPGVATVPPARPSAIDPMGSFARTVGESRQGRPIEMREVGDMALPMRLLVFACIHGDECGASSVEPLRGGCPDPGTHVDVVPNLDPDGSARRSRLNAAGVDLNRNFAAGWQPIGARGDPEYSGPRPFSEPEARLAARLVRRLHPRVTIWFHQHWGSGSFVRAWGQSAPAARRFAALAGLRFRLMRWPAGTAPNWQNHAFPGTASFVVELPRGKVPQARRIRLDQALGRFGEEVEEDPRVARKG